MMIWLKLSNYWVDTGKNPDGDYNFSAMSRDVEGSIISRWSSSENMIPEHLATGVKG